MQILFGVSITLAVFLGIASIALFTTGLGDNNKLVISSLFTTLACIGFISVAVATYNSRKYLPIRYNNYLKNILMKQNEVLDMQRELEKFLIDHPEFKDEKAESFINKE